MRLEKTSRGIQVIRAIPEIPDTLLPAKECARRLGVSPSTFRNLCLQLRVTSYGHGKKLIRYDWAEVVTKLRLPC